MSQATLSIKKYPQEGDLNYTYSPLRNVLAANTENGHKENEIIDFDVADSEFPIDLNYPLNIECQPSYDGTVNLIINDDIHPPRIINTRFSKIEDNRFRIINRNQLQQTNLYNENKVDQQTRLFRNINSIPRFDLYNIYNNGQLMGGNYTFYLKFADNDYNKTDIVAESGQISIFKGYLDKISSISGTIVNERTDKAISLVIRNIDVSFSKMYLYFTRETCDVNGLRITEAGMFKEPYEIKSKQETIVINGFEEIEPLTPEEINIQYNLVTAVKTQTQVQNMLFFGNVQGVNVDIKQLQNISYFIQVTLKQGSSIGFVSPNDYKVKSGDDLNQSEYYNPLNIYYKLGYWPEEIYRLGVVYIMKDDSLSPVFDLRGHAFTGLNDTNYTNETLFNGQTERMNYLERGEFLQSAYLDNTFGVFRNPSVNLFNYTSGSEAVTPLYYEMSLTNEVKGALRDLGVKGFFFVRQKRIPTILCQALSVGIDRSSYVPMLYDGSNYFTERFLSNSGILVQSFEAHKVKTQYKQGSGLISVDANSIPQLKSNFDGSEFILKPYYQTEGTLNADKRHFYTTYSGSSVNSTNFVQASGTFIESETPLKYINGFGFSTKCGVQEDVSQFAFFDKRDYGKDNPNLLRGVYCPFIGVNTSLKDNMIYSIKTPNFSESMIRDYFLVRKKDLSPFFAISDRYELSSVSGNQTVDVYRGDCYTNTVTVRINRNFVDSEVPINDTIIDPNTWKDHYKGYLNTVKSSNEEDEDSEKGDYTLINRADVNTVNLGMWVTFKCLSNYNLGLRSIDNSFVDEVALMGSPRGFYPIRDMSVVVSHKIEESWLLNQGYSATMGCRRNFIAPNVPYIKDMFDNRVMFSNVQREDEFKNAYRIFQGLSFKDIDRQYGAIVKLISWGVNILCVFEHGIGILPINEKALIQTTTGQAVHMYGAGVLQNQISLISPDYGSIWQESIIRTPKGVYGVDTYAKKIWRYTDANGLENISDMKVQQFLNNFIILKERDKYPIISLRNVKSHYNNYKGDIMFTFYNDAQDTTWNLCYNERMDKWITRYSWTPLYSENINNIFYSFDQNRAKILGCIYDNLHCTYGIRTGLQEWAPALTSSDLNIPLKMQGYELITSGATKYTIDTVETSYIDSYTGNEIELKIDNSKLTYVSGNNTLPIFTIDSNTGEFPHKIHSVYSRIKTWFDNNYGTNSMPVYFKFNLTAQLKVDAENTDDEAISFIKDSVGLVIDAHAVMESNTHFEIEGMEYNEWAFKQNAFLRNGVYLHGRAGIFNQINYDDQYYDNQILPTKWYERQEPFEFEFVVNSDIGLHKIFDNLVIISNNVQPNEIEYEIVGDVYNFNKAGIYRNQRWNEGIWNQNRLSTKPGVIIPEQNNNRRDIDPDDWPYRDNRFRGDTSTPRVINGKKYQSTQELINCRVDWDTTLNSYSLIMNQPCKNIEYFGRRLGNIHYKEDAWYITIDPIMFREKFKIDNATEENFGPIKSTRVRDKFVKIRVKYTGEDIVIITALRTMLTLSYA